jgi:hypothetical protein
LNSSLSKQMTTCQCALDCLDGRLELDDNNNSNNSSAQVKELKESVSRVKTALNQRLLMAQVSDEALRKCLGQFDNELSTRLGDRGQGIQRLAHILVNMVKGIACGEQIGSSIL